MVLLTHMYLNIQQDIPLAGYTSWKIGGTAKWLIEPSIDELPYIFNWAWQQGVPVYFLGRASNVLIGDEGLPGLVVLTRNSLTRLYREKECIVAESGVFLPHVSTFAAREGVSGFEFLVGIPGTVGGALVMNAGLTMFRPREMVEIVQDFDVLNLDGSTETLTMEDVNVGYRCTDLSDGQRFILRVRFRLEHEDSPENIRHRTFEHLAERKRKQPLDKPTAGSTFKSLATGKGAGWYIEQSGLKGVQIGGARVSSIHANWIENVGNATAADVRQLIQHIQTVVKSRMGIELEPEVRFLP